MSEHLRALLVLMFLGVGYFYAARGVLSQLLPEETFKRWRNLWLVATVVLFLSHSILLCFLMLGAMLLTYRRREAQVMGLYFALLFVAPPAPAEIPGLGIIDHFWVLTHYRLLAVTLLLPAALSLFQRSTTARLGSSPVDWMVLGYVSLMSLLAFRQGNVTDGLRSVFSLWVDIFLPYYVASRSIRSEDGLKQAMTGYLIAAMILSIVAVFEVLRSWKLYSAVLGALGVNEWMFGGYLTRSGLLRPGASVGNSIVLGYVLVVALGFFLYLREFISKPLHRFFGTALLTAGIVASLSRGPWVGAAFLMIMYLMIGPKPFKRLGSLVLGVVAFFLMLSFLPGGDLLIDMLPIFGSVEQGNVEYRANLLTSALPVIGRNFLFGSYDYLDAPELQIMMQGERIIDVVNSYVGVALYSGLIGLAFFLGAFFCALHQLRKSERAARKFNHRTALLGRALFATVSAIMLIIYTVSSISAIPVVYWAVLGLSVAYVSLVSQWARKPEEVPAS
jgi:hypothetical protein